MQHEHCVYEISKSIWWEKASQCFTNFSPIIPVLVCVLPLLVLPVPTLNFSIHAGRRKQKPSEDEDVGVLKKPKLEESKGFIYSIYSSGMSCLHLMSGMLQVLLLQKHGLTQSWDVCCFVACSIYFDQSRRAYLVSSLDVIYNLPT